MQTLGEATLVFIASPELSKKDDYIESLNYMHQAVCKTFFFLSMEGHAS